MSDALRIHSSLRDYAVEFVDDFAVPLARHVREGAFVVCDAKVHALYRDVLAPIVPEGQLLLVEATELGKTMDAAQALIAELVARQARRHHTIVALGGGVCEDVAGFTASVLYRGVEWVYFPTTLLSMADSAIGGKTSINVGEKKNLVGTFYPPSAVYVDTRFLDTLGVDDIRSGLGEILHFYVYADSPLLPDLAAHYSELLEDRAGFDALHGLFVANFPDFDWRRLDLARYTAALSADKKNVDGGVTCVLSAGPGKLVKKRLAMDPTLAALIERYFEGPVGAEPGPVPALEIADAS